MPFPKEKYQRRPSLKSEYSFLNQKLRWSEKYNSENIRTESDAVEALYNEAAAVRNKRPSGVDHRIHYNTMMRAVAAQMSRRERLEYVVLRRKRKKKGGLSAAEELHYKNLRKRARKYRKMKKNPYLHLEAYRAYMAFAMKAHRDTMEMLRIANSD